MGEEEEGGGGRAAATKLQHHRDQAGWMDGWLVGAMRGEQIII